MLRKYTAALPVNLLRMSSSEDNPRRESPSIGKKLKRKQLNSLKSWVLNLIQSDKLADFPLQISK
jgi:hypothetical protein